ncbi:MAG: ABC transporter permease [Candidatus Excrementavichristensenella sp.]
MWPLIKNNCRIILARKVMLFMLLILPMVAFSLGLLNNSTQIARMNVGVVDHDNTLLSETLTTLLSEDGSQVQAVAEAEADDSLLKGTLEAVVTIPAGFEADFMKARDPEIPIRTLKGQEVTGSLKAGIDITLSGLARLRDIRQPESAQALVDAMKEVETHGFQFKMQRITTGEVNQALNFASGFLFYVLAMSMMQATSLILEEKHWNTLGRVRQAPVGKFAFLIANFLSAVIFLLLNLLGLHLITRFVMPVKTTFLMYLLWFYYGIIWIFFGIFLALSAKSRAVYSSLIPIVTTIFAMLGGSFWPLWLMPSFMQKLAMITPHYWAIDAMTLIQKGQSLLIQRTDLLALTGFLVVFASLGLFALRRSQSLETFY